MINRLPAKALHSVLTDALKTVSPPVATSLLDAGPVYWRQRAIEALYAGETKLPLILVALIGHEQAVCEASEKRRKDSGGNNIIPPTPSLGR